MEKLIVTYSQVGHYMYPEDTWEDREIIETEKDFLRVCKNWHKLSARSFNDYPYGGLFSFNNIKFQKQNFIAQDGETFYGERRDCEKPEYFDKVKADFDTWLEEIKIRLPKLRQAQSERLKKEAELEKFKELSLKYLK